MNDDAVREYWDGRAELGKRAGTDDLIARELEVRAIERYVEDGMHVLDAGCGNGQTLADLESRYAITGVGIDFSPAMIAATQKYHSPSLEYMVADLRALPHLGTFDLIYTQRVIINLPDWETQRGAVVRLLDLLRLGGRYVMCENSQDGLDELNQVRSTVGLPAILPPWHNRYLRDGEVAQLANDLSVVQRRDVEMHTEYPLATYAFLSRVVNAALAEREGRAPDYDAPINRLALSLPATGTMGQNSLWVWRRKRA